MTALRHAPAPDDSDVDSRNSVMNVDYLSHEWQEEADVWASWRHTTRHKNDIANGVRLENASWRTWWKQRNKLKTVSPETLNWLKDSDVTWLYGPLHTAAEPVPPMKVAGTEDRLDLVKAMGKKPILKHRSISELLSIPRGSSPSLESVHLDSIAEEGEPERPVLQQTKSESYITKSGIRRVSPPLPDLAHAPDIVLTNEDSTDSPGRVGSDTESMTSGTKRHISFNTFVEQCIAIEKPPRGPSAGQTPWRVGFGSTSYAAEDEDDNVIYEDDDDDGTILTMRSTSSSGQSSTASSRRPSSSSRSQSAERLTIASIAPTMLKTQYDAIPGESPAVVYAPPLGSPYSEDPSIAPAGQYFRTPSQTLNSSPSGQLSRSTAATRSQWEDEDQDRGVGFDFFAGPDVGAEDEYGVSRVKNHTRVIHSAPVVPSNVYPKSSASASIAPAAPTAPSPPRLVSPVRSPPTSPRSTKVPGKSILKQSGQHDTTTSQSLRDGTEKSDSYFSDNPAILPSPPPSRALGDASSATSPPSLDDQIASIIAGKGLSPSSVASLDQPPTSPTTERARGRSAMRIPGTGIGIADRERSSSKGSSPIGSVSPNSSRPVSSVRIPVVRAGSSRMEDSWSANSPHTGTNDKRSISRSSVESKSSRSSEVSSVLSSVDEPSSGGGQSDVTVSPKREEGFQPSKSNPVRSPNSKKRLSMDIVPVLPTQLAPAQLSPGSDPPSRVQGSATLPGTGASSWGRQDLEKQSMAVALDDDGAPDGTDAYTYHSTNPTPVNSPINSLKPLPGSNVASDSSSASRSTSGTGPSSMSRSVNNVNGLGASAPPDGQGDESRDSRDDGNLVSRAVDIVSSARGLIGAIWSAGVGHPASTIDSSPPAKGRRVSEG